MPKLSYREFIERIDIDEVEASLGFEVLRRDGDNDIGQCILPYGLHTHGDTTGKMGIHREKMVYNCWLCGGGSLLDLVMAVNDADAETATDWLFQFTKAKDQTGEVFVGKMKERLHTQATRSATLPYYNERTLEKWRTDEHPWFKDRGIRSEVAALYKLGFNEQAVKYAPKKEGRPIGEPFKGQAIVLPHFWMERLVGWQHRWLESSLPPWCQKYTNSPDFPRQNTLFGYDLAKRSGQEVVLVESVPTALFLVSIGHPAVATFGASVSETQARLLRVFQHGLILAPDNDNVGQQKYWSLGHELHRYIPLKWIDPESLPAKGDLGDLSSDPDRASNCIENAQILLGSWVSESSKR